MKTDCIFIVDDCYLPANKCNDDCERYERDNHPLREEENKGCVEYHMKKDMGEK